MIELIIVIAFLATTTLTVLGVLDKDTASTIFSMLSVLASLSYTYRKREAVKKRLMKLFGRKLH